MRLIRKSLIYFLLALCRLSFAQNPVYIVPDSVICWDEKVKLQWKDFKGKTDTMLFNSAATCSHIQIIPHYNEKLKRESYKVTNKFIKNLSWVKDTNFALSIALLAHEQLHFDISELYARKIRYEIFRLDSVNKNIDNNLKLYLEKINTLLNEKTKTNVLYDYETNHGSLITKQSEWNKQIHSELNKLKKYATTIQDCGILKDDEE